MKEIVLIIDEMGNIQAEATGFKGQDCTKATEWLKLLGETEVKFKPEYYLHEANNTRLRGR